jgi:hypothetical protein
VDDGLEEVEGVAVEEFEGASDLPQDAVATTMHDSAEYRTVFRKVLLSDSLHIDSPLC